MKIADFLVDFLIKHGTTDAFGLPGGVVLDLMYAMDKRCGEFSPHLSYHEQGAGFEAVGYAQASGKLGVAYSTRGPGFTNMLTPVVDAFCDSIPVLFITSHMFTPDYKQKRIEYNQEIDTVSMVKDFTKYSVRIDRAEDFVRCLEKAYHEATSGRKGPVFLDVNTNLWKEDVSETSFTSPIAPQIDLTDQSFVKELIRNVNKSSRPIILIGDGVKQSGTCELLQQFAEKANIPVLSSRYGHDIMKNSKLYYGAIGSFGLRYSNFILSKADLIISLGNRLNFPINSASYKDVPYNAKIVRFDIDPREFSRVIPNSVNYNYPLEYVLPILAQTVADWGDRITWIKTCNEIRDKLFDADVNDVVQSVGTLLTAIKDEELAITNDVGENEFWVSRACAYAGYEGISLYSKSFATLGCALPKAIGAYYSTRKPVVCFAGDQAIQMNIQEFQLISVEQIPVLVVVMNNFASGMIRDKQTKSKRHYLHTTLDSGYGIPSMEDIARSYGFKYLEFRQGDDLSQIMELTSSIDGPILLNLMIDSKLSLAPVLPRGNKTQDMDPKLEIDLYEYLNNL